MDTALIRRARPDDAAEMARVVGASIRDLCGADHHDDPEILDRWLADKTAAAFAARIAGPTRLVAAELSGRLAGVGEIEGAGPAGGRGKITLMYVAPEARGLGVSTALLSAMEAELAGSGVRRADLTATATARAFYLARGWQVAAPARQGRWIVGHPLTKALPVAAHDGTHT